MPYYDCLLFWVAMVTMCFVCCGITWTRTRRGFSPQIWHILKTLLVLQTHTWKRSRGHVLTCEWRLCFLWLIWSPSFFKLLVRAGWAFRRILLKPFPLSQSSSWKTFSIQAKEHLPRNTSDWQMKLQQTKCAAVGLWVRWWTESDWDPSKTG